MLDNQGTVYWEPHASRALLLQCNSCPRLHVRDSTHAEWTREYGHERKRHQERDDLCSVAQEYSLGDDWSCVVVRHDMLRTYHHVVSRLDWLRGWPVNCIALHDLLDDRLRSARGAGDCRIASKEEEAPMATPRRYAHMLARRFSRRARFKARQNLKRVEIESRPYRRFCAWASS